MFEHFDAVDVPTPRGTIRARVGGAGQPLLLLHGFPQTHLMWHAVAGALSERFSVVAADLPGYGDSFRPPASEDHSSHSKRALAEDLRAAMRELGHETFAVAGHDRGGRVAYRMALDHPETVSRLAVLDIVPTGQIWSRADAAFALDYWHWSFLAQPAPVPEQLILGAGDAFWITLERFGLRGGERYPESVLSAYRAQCSDPATVQAMCEDYRAGATIDRQLDDADRGRRTIGCPVLALWAGEGSLPHLYGDPLALWRELAPDVRGRVIPHTSHFFVEDDPDVSASELLEFFSEPEPDPPRAGGQRRAQVASAALRTFAPETMVLVGDLTRHGGGAQHALKSLASRASVEVGVVDSRANPSIGPADILAATGGVAADLALICALPAEDAMLAAEACASAGVGGIAIVGVPPHPELRGRLVRIAESTPTRILGPNAFGPYNGKGNLFIRPYAGQRDSRLAIFTQSGNFLSDVVEVLRALSDSAPHVGWALGNMVDLHLADAITAAASDDSLRAIAVHCEGMSEGRRLMRAIRVAAERKPVVVLLAGTSDAGKRLTISHTASMGVSEVLASGAARQAGAAVAGRVDEFTILADSLGRTSPAAGSRVTVVADGGGHATLAADRLVAAGFEIASLAPETAARISTLVGYEIDPDGPLDVDDLDRPTLAFQAGSILAAAPEVDIVFLVGSLGSYATHFSNEALADADLKGAHTLTAALSVNPKPVVAALAHSLPKSEAHRALREGGVAVVRSIDHGVTICRELVQRGRFLAHLDSRSTIPNVPARADEGLSRHALPEPEARSRLNDGGIDAGSFATVTSARECAETVSSFGRPCALKIVSPSIVHKSDVGGVALDVTAAAAEAAFTALLDRVRSHVGEFEFDGVLVTPMASRGVELLVGAYRDPDLGPCIAVGSGGYLVDLLKDVVFRTAPVTQFEAEEMLSATRAGALLDGYRGSEPVDKAPITELIAELSQLILRDPEIEEIDLNPVIAGADGPQLVDVRVVIRR